MIDQNKQRELEEVLAGGVYSLDAAAEQVGLDGAQAQTWYDAGEGPTAPRSMREFRAAVDRGRRRARAAVEGSLVKAATGGWSPSPPDAAVEVHCPSCEEVLDPAVVAQALPPTYFRHQLKFVPPSHQAAKAFLEKVSPDVWGKNAVEAMDDEQLVEALAARPSSTIRNIISALMRLLSARARGE